MRLEVAVCAVLALAACHRAVDSFRVDTDVRKDSNGRATVRLRVTDLLGKQVDGAQIELEGNMTHAGMSPVFGKTEALGNGRYRGSLELSMPGDWVILVHGRLANGTVLEREIVVK